MKEDRKMMVMEVKLAALAKLGAKEPVGESWGECCCGSNNNVQSSESPVMSGSSSWTNNQRKFSGDMRHRFSNRDIKREEVMALKSRFPTKIPVIVKKYAACRELPELDKCKFLVPQDLTMGQFQGLVRSRMKLSPTQAIYLLVNGKELMSSSVSISEVYSAHEGPHGYLYVTYASQETFGGHAEA